jgi:hypothetical protein
VLIEDNVTILKNEKKETNEVLEEIYKRNLHLEV